MALLPPSGIRFDHHAVESSEQCIQTFNLSSRGGCSQSKTETEEGKTNIHHEGDSTWMCPRFKKSEICNLKSMNMMKHDIYYYSYKSSLDQLYAG